MTSARRWTIASVMAVVLILLSELVVPTPYVVVRVRYPTGDLRMKQTVCSPAVFSIFFTAGCFLCYTLPVPASAPG